MAELDLPPESRISPGICARTTACFGQDSRNYK